MFKEEIKKALRSPMKWILCALILLNVLIIIIDFIDIKSQVGDIKTYNDFVRQYEGEYDVELIRKIQKETENYRNGDGVISEVTTDVRDAGKDYFYSDYCLKNEYRETWKHVEGETEQYPVSYDGIEEYVKNPKNKKENLYPIIKKEFQMLSVIGAPNKYYNMIGINKITGLLTGGFVSFISIMIAVIVIVNATFSIENSSGMISIILSTPNGRGKLLRSKLIVVQLMTFVWITLYFWVCVILDLVLYDKFDKLALPLNNINSFYMSPYNITIGQFFVISYLLYVVGGFSIASIFSVLSLSIKNAVMNFGIGLVGYMLPLFLPTNGTGGTIALLFPNMSMQANMLFQEMQAVNIGGNVLMLFVIAPIISIVIGLLLYNISYKVYIKSNIE